MFVQVLGSVSPRCYKDKNGICYKIVTENNYKILLDLGPGSSRLLEMNDLNDLIIIISHLHKDHYSDLLSLGYDSFVLHRIGLLKNKIKVYIPFDEDLLDYKYLMGFTKDNYLEFIPYKENNTLNIDNVTITFKQNPHSVLTYSAKIKSDDGIIVYSADTGYINNSLEDFAKDSNILICESTFLKNQNKVGNDHLYTYEAGLIAKSCNVERLILTHFYPTIDKNLYLEETKDIFKDVDVAEEGKIYKLRR